MGKQIQTCIHKGKKDLLVYLIEKGYWLVAKMKVKKKYKIVYVNKKNDLSEAFLEQNFIHVATKDVIKGLTIMVRDNGNKYWKYTDKLIELWFSNIIVEEKRIVRGRVYFGNGFSEQLTEEESKAGNEVYKDVVKWVKKNVPYRLLPYGREKTSEWKIYVEDFLYDLIVNQGYSWR